MKILLLILAVFVGFVLVTFGLAVVNTTKADGYCDALHGERNGDLCVRGDTVVHRFDGPLFR